MGFADAAPGADLYGPPASRSAFQTAEDDPAIRPDAAFSQRWLLRSQEVVDKYQPDLVWFDNKLNILDEQALLEFLSHGRRLHLHHHNPV